MLGKPYLDPLEIALLSWGPLLPDSVSFKSFQPVAGHAMVWFSGIYRVLPTTRYLGLGVLDHPGLESLLAQFLRVSLGINLPLEIASGVLIDPASESPCFIN